MSKKNKPDARGYVYSTDPEFSFEHVENRTATLLARQQQLRLRLDTRQRAGKAVTLVQGFIGLPEDLEALGKKLKTLCGTGGSVKQGEIIVQGDHREKLLQWLLKNNYTASKIV